MSRREPGYEVDRIFTVAEARALMPDVRRRAEQLVVVRADFTELSLALRRGTSSPLGGIPEAKALEAALHEHLGWFTSHGIEVKGLAPLLVDFPSTRDDEAVLLCWLEGESDLAWFHRLDHGFAGRRPLDD